MQRANSDGLQTLLVGLDAACEPVLEELQAAEAIPTISSLMADGVADQLQSQLPPWTPSAWPSMYTGVNPGKHGVYGFLSFDGYDWDVVNRTDVRERALWEVLSERGISSVVCNVPVTHPPNDFDGALVPGYTAPESPACHPEGLLEDLRSEVGEYRVYRDKPADPSDDEGQIAAYEEKVEQRGAAFRYLLDRVDPGFGFLQFQQTDTVFHEMPEHEAAAERIYRAVDRELEAILAETDPDVVLLASDHGIGPFDGYEFRVNDFLSEEGFVETVADGEGMPSWASIARNKLQDGEESGDVEPSLAERAVAAAGTVGLTAQRMGRILEALHLDDVVLEHVPADVVRAASERVDFAESTAYFRDRIELGVRINLEGREPEGTVPPERYDAVRSDLRERLEAVQTPDGEPLFDAVLPREEIFEGPYVEEAPDLVLVPADYEHYLSTTLRDGDPFGEPSDAWTHKEAGYVVAAGSGVDATASLEGAHLFDVAPTVLASFGIPAAERMDGSVLPVVEDAGREPYPPYEPDAAGTVADDADRAGEDVEDRLNALGYLEQD